ncbi:hypothetical protein SAM23877_0330 [Streptomyces ambofaciens ATCC 23877]|uniref:Uncharacterized protein n=1 Tax=Streptomyces ambofaciens (strain ATCC 23877 / 3486 / DSM 40053 / JCM 4204 / NBRC 12836 / NRRL B-2516) TaxID=278992 RepID=A0A0K2AK58_STRA7|nr:hypothetical protein SAM23877_0330 [Streptomyces ambofaciens ATCC 23877]
MGRSRRLGASGAVERSIPRHRSRGSQSWLPGGPMWPAPLAWLTSSAIRSTFGSPASFDAAAFGFDIDQPFRRRHRYRRTRSEKPEAERPSPQSRERAWVPSLSPTPTGRTPRT